MRFDSGTTDVPTAGNAVQISDTADKVKTIAVRARVGNTGNMYFGVSDVSATNGWELEPGDHKEIDFGEGSVLFSSFFVDAATSGSDLDWAVVLQ